jgi:hypothetical protein
VPVSLRAAVFVTTRPTGRSHAHASPSADAPAPCAPSVVGVVRYASGRRIHATGPQTSPDAAERAAARWALAQGYTDVVLERDPR